MTNRKLPFDCAVGTEPETVQNIFGGDSVTIPADAVAVYDVIMGSNLMAEKTSDPKMRDKHYKTVRKGLDWFMRHEPKAYMVLLD
jgi:hypothetical protein|tara:strand:- start:540 stop:794 length:255 start_codon:yes stop_codon:yes gene_type:complete